MITCFQPHSQTESQGQPCRELGTKPLCSQPQPPCALAPAEPNCPFPSSHSTQHSFPCLRNLWSNWAFAWNVLYIPTFSDSSWPLLKASCPSRILSDPSLAIVSSIRSPVGFYPVLVHRLTHSFDKHYLSTMAAAWRQS